MTWNVHSPSPSGRCHPGLVARYDHGREPVPHLIVTVRKTHGRQRGPEGTQPHVGYAGRIRVNRTPNHKLSTHHSPGLSQSSDAAASGLSWSTAETA